MAENLIAELKARGCDVDTTLAETFMGNEAFYAKMFAKLAKNTCLGRMREALAASDAAALFSASHELKGVYASLGLTPLWTLCADIVEPARAGSVDGAAEKLSKLEALHSEIVSLA